MKSRMDIIKQRVVRNIIKKHRAEQAATKNGWQDVGSPKKLSEILAAIHSPLEKTPPKDVIDFLPEMRSYSRLDGAALKNIQTEFNSKHSPFLSIAEDGRETEHLFVQQFHTVHTPDGGCLDVPGKLPFVYESGFETPSKNIFVQNRNELPLRTDATKTPLPDQELKQMSGRAGRKKEDIKPVDVAATMPERMSQKLKTPNIKETNPL